MCSGIYEVTIFENCITGSNVTHGACICTVAFKVTLHIRISI